MFKRKPKSYRPDMHVPAAEGYLVDLGEPPLPELRPEDVPSIEQLRQQAAQLDRLMPDVYEEPN